MSGRNLKQGRLSFSTSRRTRSSASASLTKGDKQHKTQPQRRSSRQSPPQLEIISVDDDDDVEEDEDLIEHERESREESQVEFSPLSATSSESSEGSPPEKKRVGRAGVGARAGTRRKAELAVPAAAAAEPSPRKRARGRKIPESKVDVHPAPEVGLEELLGEESKEKLERWRRHYGWVRAQMGYLPPGGSFVQSVHVRTGSLFLTLSPPPFFSACSAWRGPHDGGSYPTDVRLVRLSLSVLLRIYAVLCLVERSC